MKAIEIMKKVDDAIFQNVEKLKVYDQYQEFSENFNNWEENHQNIFKVSLVASIFVIPGLILLIFLSLNSSANNGLETKNEILKIASKISSQKNEVTKLSTKYLGQAISTKNMLQSQLKSNLGSMNIDPANIVIDKFDSFEENNLNKVDAHINFKGLSSQNLFSFLRLVTLKKKMRVDEINIEKNIQSNLLSGKIKIFHFSKLSGGEAED